MFTTRPAALLRLFALRRRCYPAGCPLRRCCCPPPSLLPPSEQQYPYAAPRVEGVVLRCWSSSPAESQDNGSYVLPEFDFSDALKDTSMESAESDPEPQMPGPEDCCQAGCVNCVWKIYNERHRKWVARQKGEEPAEDPFDKLERELAEKAAARKAESERTKATQRNSTGEKDSE